MHLSFVGVGKSSANRPGDHLDDHRFRAFARVGVERKGFDEVGRQLTEHAAGAQERVGEAGNVILGCGGSHADKRPPGWDVLPHTCNKSVTTEGCRRSE